MIVDQRFDIDENSANGTMVGTVTNERSVRNVMGGTV